MILFYLYSFIYVLQAIDAYVGLLQIDGFEQETQVVIIAATNRKQDLDPALLR